MEELAPLENMLNKLTELYELVLSNQAKSLEIPPEITEAVSRLAKEIDELSKVTNQELMRAGISQETIQETIYGSKSQLPPDVQNLLIKSQQLKLQVEGCQNVLRDIIKKQKEDAKIQQGTGQKRKDKFKNIGSKKGWIPM